MENYKHIHYLECPHFTVGRADQWGERGYLLFDGKVYSYEEDRKEQCGMTTSPVAIKDFLVYADKNQIAIPESFMEKLREADRD